LRVAALSPIRIGCGDFDRDARTRQLGGELLRKGRERRSQHPPGQVSQDEIVDSKAQAAIERRPLDGIAKDRMHVAAPVLDPDQAAAPTGNASVSPSEGGPILGRNMWMC